MKQENNFFICIGWKILNLENIKLNIKYEFNTNNKNLYKEDFIIAKS